ncbi:HalX domain-containing protein [Haloarchaeobius litoreus]|uniref:HalX domain-containing protein n=1 Tax=Haloarchaeobius litoreus TaxID=755306 RepID=A0ABD6DNR0_9EURY|nr:HalX domain-containing protein [Haloarchaeobius litoreus]
MRKRSTDVLVVEDNTELASLYSSWLGAEWAVTTVADGDEAVDAVTPETDIIVLDRRLPGRSGDEVLERVREDGNDCQVVIVTAVEPDFDIIEMGFDDYLVKPVDRETLNRCLDRLQCRSEYDEELREYYAQVSKKAVLEARKPKHELRESEEYRELEARVEDQADRADSLLNELIERGGDVQLFHGLLGGHAGTAN